jgi:signal peptidase II
VWFILWDNLPARLCRFHFIRATHRKKQRTRGHKPMLIEIAAAVSVIAADQASKAFVLSRSWPADSNAGFLSVRKVLMRRGPLMFYFTPWMHVGLWIASIAIAAVLVRAGMIAENARNAAAIGAALGGAAGNIADRLRRGAIVDFIAIGRCPPFNLADVAIVAGVGTLVWSLVAT